MGRGGKVGCRGNFRKRARSEEKGSDDSDAYYVVSDEKDVVSDDSEDYGSFLDGCASEESFADYVVDEVEDEVEEVKKVARPKPQRGFSGRKRKTCGKASRKRKRALPDDKGEEEDDEDYDVNDDDDDDEDNDDEKDEEFTPVDEEFMLEDEEFTADEDDCLEEEEEEEFRVTRKMRSKKLAKRGSQRKGQVRGRKKRKRSDDSRVSKKPLQKKGRRSKGLRRKAKSDDDDGSASMDKKLVVRKKSRKNPGRSRSRYVVQSDSDFVSSGSSDFEYTISEEEREQVREASELCREASRYVVQSGCLPDQRSTNNLSNRPPGMNFSEGIDLNSFPSAHTTSAPGFVFFSPPRHSVGDGRAASPVTAAVASTLTGRRLMLNHFFMRMASRGDGISAVNSNGNSLSSQINPGRETLFQSTRMQDMGPPPNCSILGERLPVNPSPLMQNMDISSSGLNHSRSQAVQNSDAIVSNHRTLNGTLLDEHARISSFLGFELRGHCSSRPSTGSDDRVSPSTIKEDNYLQQEKELLQSMVKKHLQSLCTNIELVHTNNVTYCEGCRPQALGSTSSHAEGCLPDQRSTNNLSNRPPGMSFSEGIDLNSFPSAHTTSAPGFGLFSPPRHSVGDGRAASPATGGGASTLTGRRLMLNHFLMRMASRGDGISAVNSNRNSLSSQINLGRETLFQSTRMQDMGPPPNCSILGERLPVNPSPLMQNLDISSSGLNHSRSQAVQNSDAIVSNHRTLNGTLLDEHARINSFLGFELRGHCSSRPSTGSDDRVSPSTIKEDNYLQQEKELLQSMVKKHLQSLCTNIELDHTTLEDITRKSTHTTLAACGLEHSSSEVCLELQPFICPHIAVEGGQISLMKGSCLRCFDSFVRDVVHRILNTKLPPWLAGTRV